MLFIDDCMDVVPNLDRFVNDDVLQPLWPIRTSMGCAQSEWSVDMAMARSDLVDLEQRVRRLCYY